MEKYVCVNDYQLGQNSDFLGISKTIEGWKYWLLKDRLETYYEVGGCLDKNCMASYIEMANLKENEVINYIEDLYEIKLLPLNNINHRYIDIETEKLLTEFEVRKLLFEMETEDILNNFEDYMCGDIDIDISLNRMKKAMCGKIEEIVAELEMWNILIKKIK